MNESQIISLIKSFILKVTMLHYEAKTNIPLVTRLFRSTAAWSGWAVSFSLYCRFICCHAFIFRRTVPLLVQVQDIPRLDLHMGNYSYTALHYTTSQVSNKAPVPLISACSTCQREKV